jgi:hypothetical protein
VKIKSVRLFHFFLSQLPVDYLFLFLCHSQDKVLCFFVYSSPPRPATLVLFQWFATSRKETREFC